MARVPAQPALPAARARHRVVATARVRVQPGLGEKAEGTGIVGEGLPGVGGACGFVDGFVFRFEFGLKAGHFVIHQGRLRFPGTALAPGARDHLLDEMSFRRSYGFVLLEIRGGEKERLLFVPGGALFALRGLGTSRFGAVLTGGLDLFFGGHD